MERIKIYVKSEAQGSWRVRVLLAMVRGPGRGY